MILRENGLTVTKIADASNNNMVLPPDSEKWGMGVIRSHGTKYFPV